jgi:hypothetical protein
VPQNEHIETKEKQLSAKGTDTNNTNNNFLTKGNSEHNTRIIQDKESPWI